MKQDSSRRCFALFKNTKLKLILESLPHKGFCFFTRNLCTKYQTLFWVFYLYFNILPKLPDLLDRNLFRQGTRACNLET
ncbi:hypothetical protein Bca4012_000621 [Brassica carinata]